MELIIPEGSACLANSSFSKTIPGLQTVIDSTSLELFKTCPRKYYFAMVRGFESVFGQYHLEFGVFLHDALQHHDMHLASGMDYDQALEATLRYLLTISAGWVSSDPKNVKTKDSLVRSVVWYIEHYRNDPFKTLILDDGKAAVELSFKLPTGIQAPDGEEYIVSGHLDKVVSDSVDQLWVKDYKTTSSAPDQKFVDGFSPHNQMTLYNAAGKVILNRPVAGVIIDGIQVGVNFTRFGRGFSPRTSGQLNEFWATLGYYLKLMAMSAQAREWPMNESSCDKYGGCKFREVCAADPSLKENYLKNGAKFKVKIWDPLENR